MKVLVTCPPMLKQIENYKEIFQSKKVELVLPSVVQTMTEDELVEILPSVHGWIIGDDPATYRVLEAGVSGRLRAAVKWGVGVDNVDFEAADKLGLSIDNTPGMFGQEVSDIAVAYVIGLARDLYFIDREVRSGRWVKPTGDSIQGKTAAVVGLGDIGRNTAMKLRALRMKVTGFDPNFDQIPGLEDVEKRLWPDILSDADYLIFTCALTKSSYHMFDHEALGKIKSGLRLVNVARGPLVDESALLEGLSTEKIISAALDVFEIEPLSQESKILQFPKCILGSHNASNTREAVDSTSHRAIKKLFSFLELV